MKIYLKENNILNPTSNLTITLEFNNITNDNEKADTLNKQADGFRKMKGVISDETLLKHHPMVEDVEKEIARLKGQEDDYFGAGNMKTLFDKKKGKK
jgi:hypothetical protein